ncbi:uncharacterized protein C8Q71DRAFT_165307 [Rhodofomes roseus]|uniref:Uncharacterized protein n=1 Tax=Rhodofomes roseus TaxID=34475 RepID=A0ABQ8KA37_9APHY|nr:uncharacterized protein C8Q71DRAFT_165307 [Rhodofomes roseus]KAH9834178.1 hypothetical protein C8Q71DRAFT_165307 [Rhodofomes roseus]
MYDGDRLHRDRRVRKRVKSMDYDTEQVAIRADNGPVRYPRPTVDHLDRRPSATSDAASFRARLPPERIIGVAPLRSDCVALEPGSVNCAFGCTAVHNVRTRQRREPATVQATTSSMGEVVGHAHALAAGCSTLLRNCECGRMVCDVTAQVSKATRETAGRVARERVHVARNRRLWNSSRGDADVTCTERASTEGRWEGKGRWRLTSCSWCTIPSTAKPRRSRRTSPWACRGQQQGGPTKQKARRVDE